ncbi:hypothetical protein [Pseudalkalibacillus salsuginis]|uniref:hypothetical protein n=1 Tax=Pseudalkalibacillus salsuginis TaxID=2910972 RepID=UPI001F3FE00C|nr:hypothetical protein [Pseudalkalibacillus salsuginis]MCF6409396.1 hypothetical protein [Pseudalkalibacillus salsuginis]
METPLKAEDHSVLIKEIRKLIHEFQNDPNQSTFDKVIELTDYLCKLENNKHYNRD